MYIDETLGVSEYTPVKQKHFEYILRAHVAITKAVLARHSYFNQHYHFIDASAGPGRYEHPSKPQREIIGSPLIFLSVAERMGVKYRADFIELNADFWATLSAEVGISDDVRVHLGDYRAKVPEILGDSKRTVRNDFGLFYLDLSGPGTTLPDFGVVAHVAEMRPKMEILVHIPAQVLKRVRIVFPGHWGSLGDMIDRTGKPHWLIREPYGLPFQWTFLLGSATDIFKDYKAIGFYRLESDQGMAIFEKLNFTRKEIQRDLQPVLDLPGISPLPALPEGAGRGPGEGGRAL